MALAFKNAQKLSSSSRHSRAAVRPHLRHLAVVRSHKCEIQFEGKTHSFDIPDGSTILEVALDKGINLPHDCKLGVCMTCPAKLVSIVTRSTQCTISCSAMQYPSSVQ